MVINRRETNSLILDVYRSMRVAGTITANQYDYYRDVDMPVSQTLIRRSGKKWSEILSEVNLPQPLDRYTLAMFSRSLHLLEKKIKDIFAVGWQEKSFKVSGKTLRPDSFYLERSLIENGRFFLLDIKLCVSAAPITIYKYLPLFSENLSADSDHQVTFFDDWLPEAATQKPFLHYDEDGQANMALKNNVLYICYLLGKPKKDIIPLSVIASRKSSKKIPRNMEVRYIDFLELSKFYCDLANIKYEAEKVKAINKWAKEIKNLIMKPPHNVRSLVKEMYQEIKSYCAKV
ncbi:hypothetical protein [Candidatus Uabimicrobium sp. HlEnr_7]|uniref:hypothetical protein n=1 Tax=Candidatus Uabimicrobium helgolandensis TaxID=3095367 RepID=UPI003555D1E0